MPMRLGWRIHFEGCSVCSGSRGWHGLGSRRQFFCSHLPSLHACKVGQLLVSHAAVPGGWLGCQVRRPVEPRRSVLSPRGKRWGLRLRPLMGRGQSHCKGAWLKGSCESVFAFCCTAVSLIPTYCAGNPPCKSKCFF